MSRTLSWEENKAGNKNKNKIRIWKKKCKYYTDNKNRMGRINNRQEKRTIHWKKGNTTQGETSRTYNLYYNKDVTWYVCSRKEKI